MLKGIQTKDRQPLLTIENIQNYIEDLERENNILNGKCRILERNNEVLIKQKQEMYDELEVAYERIDKTINYIENEMPYLEEPDEEIERCDGFVYMTMKEYDNSILLKTLKGEE